MALSFEQMIADVQRYGDATELPITIGEGDSAQTERLRLGDIRGQLSNTLARYEAALQSERDQRVTLEQTLKTLKDAPASKEEERKPAGAPTEEDLFADPWSKQLLNTIDKRLNERVETLRGAQNEFADTSRKGVGALTTLVLRTIANQDYARFNDWPKDYDPTKAFTEAGNRGYIDKQTGLPDLTRLHHELTEDSRVELRAKALAEKLREDERKAEAEKNQSRFNKLGVPNSIRARKGKEREHRTLQDFMMSDDAIPTDDEIRNAGGLLNSLMR